MIDGDIASHFFLPKDAQDNLNCDTATKQAWNRYWLEAFPNTISPVARMQFMADVPPHRSQVHRRNGQLVVLCPRVC